jgi:dTDP-4-dehydrorhamnose 3,5-epimerase-like enzyme
MSEDNLWRGLSSETQKALRTRDYKAGGLGERLARHGIEAGELAACDRNDPELKQQWIPGVEIFARTVHPQRHRGGFGELVRRDEGPLARIGLWPVQWAAARMFAQSAKGFHIHPPSVPANEAPEKWFRQLFENEPENYSLRPYHREQWDVVFIVQGVAEIILHEARAGLPVRTMRFFVDGDNHRSRNNVGLIVPAGVAHAIRAEGSEDLITVYGTSISFRPELEGRIASEIETAELPESWRQFLDL